MNKHVRHYLVILAAWAVLVGIQSDSPIIGLLTLYVIFAPSVAFVYVAWKFYKFNYMPTPIQLVKGFSRLWPAVKRGPVVTRVKQHRSSPTP